MSSFLSTNHEQKLMTNNFVSLFESLSIYPNTNLLPLSQEDTDPGTVSTQLNGLDPEKEELFYDYLKNVQRKVVEATKKYLLQRYPEIEKDNSIVIATTGSDARGEKGTDLSPIELILITKDPKEKTKQLVQTILQDAQQGRFKSCIFPKIECKDLSDKKSTGLICEHIGAKKVTVIPTRALDALYIAGNQNLMTAYRTEMVKEIVQNKIKIRKFDHDFVKLSLRTLKNDIESKATGKASHPFVDCKKGLMFINGVDVKGVKYGGLRSIQYSLALPLFKHIKTLSASEGVRLISSMPMDTHSRISWMAQKKIINLNPEAIQQTQSTYSQLLYWYTSSQAFLKKEGEITSISLPPELLSSQLKQALEIGERLRSQKK